MQDDLMGLDYSADAMRCRHRAACSRCARVFLGAVACFNSVGL